MKVITQVILSVAILFVIFGSISTFKLLNREKISTEETMLLRSHTNNASAGNSTATCAGGANGANGGNGTNVPGAAKSKSTQVFTAAKPNSTDAAGLVGTLNFSITQPPYKVERCDQVLLLKGKKLNLTDYCIKTDAFMTLSIYMANLFEDEDSNKLLESVPLDQITTVPIALSGTLTCTQFSGKTKSFGFCYETVDILKQVIEAYEYFYRCRTNGIPDVPNILKLLLEACDISKIDFSEKGPLGKQGPIYKKMVEDYKAKFTAIKVNPELKYDPKKLNPYYSTLRAPGS